MLLKIIGNVKKTKQEVDFWTKKEFEKVILLIYKDDFYHHFLFMSLWFLFIQVFKLVKHQRSMGRLRFFETGVLSIDKTLYYKNQSDYRFTEPKTKGSIRHIVQATCFGSTKNMEECPAKSC